MLACPLGLSHRDGDLFSPPPPNNRLPAGLQGRGVHSPQSFPVTLATGSFEQSKMEARFPTGNGLGAGVEPFSQSQSPWAKSRPLRTLSYGQKEPFVIK